METTKHHNEAATRGSTVVRFLRPAAMLRAEGATLLAPVGAFGLIGGSPLTIAVALIWFAHIGMDRTVGYGLKYPTGPNDTHLNRV